MSSVPKVRARRAVRPMTRVVLVAVVLCSVYLPARAALQPLLRLRGGEQGLGEFPKVSAGFWHAIENLRWKPQGVLPAGFGMLSQTFAGYPNGHCHESVCEYAVDMRRRDRSYRCKTKTSLTAHATSPTPYIFARSALTPPPPNVRRTWANWQVKKLTYFALKAAIFPAVCVMEVGADTARARALPPRSLPPTHACTPPPRAPPFPSSPSLTPSFLPARARRWAALSTKASLLAWGPSRTIW